MWPTLSCVFLKRCGPIRLSSSEPSESSGVSGLSGYPWYPVATSSPVHMIDLSWRFKTSDLYLLLQVSLCLWTVEHPLAILENSTLRRDWNFDLCLHQSSLKIQPVDLKLWVPQASRRDRTVHRWRPCGRKLVRVIAVGLDFATILFSSFCSCILLAILSVQLSKLKFLVQHGELKWLMLNNEEDCSIRHAWGVLFVNMSAIWCLVPMYQIWILGSKLILSNNQSRATLWVFDTCLIVGLLPMIIIFNHGFIHCPPTRTTS